MAVYALGAVKPNVRKCADTVGPMFGITTIYGVGSRSTPGSDHPIGLAVDFMCDVATGRRVAAFLIANWDLFGLKYIIHEQRILESKDGSWKKMEDRGSVTANHFDHVHASFRNIGDVSVNNLNLTGENVDTSGWEKGTINPTGVDAIIAFFTSSATWYRALMFLAGLAIIVVALIPLLKGVSRGR